MGLEYRQDPGLDFLQLCSHTEMDELARTLIRQDGKERWFEQLSGDKSFNDARRVKRHAEAWQAIGAEIQRVGSDSIATIFRGGKGDLYHNILVAVANALKVPTQSGVAIPVIEERMLEQIGVAAMEKMTPAEREAIGKDFGFEFGKAAPGALMAALIAGIHGAGFAAYQAAVIVANIVAKAVIGQGLAFAANAALVRSVAIFAGPVGWGLSAATLLPLATGMNMKVSARAVIHIACLRMQYLHRAEPLF